MSKLHVTQIGGYVFVRHLMTKLPRRASGAAYQFDDEVKLEYYRLQKISEGSINLDEGYAAPLNGPNDLGGAMIRETALPLSQLVDVVNARFGTEFNLADQLFFDQVIEASTLDATLQQAARVNPREKFELLFRNVIEKVFVDRMDQNEEIFVRFMNDTTFQSVVTKAMAAEAYSKLRSATDSSALSGDDRV